MSYIVLAICFTSCHTNIIDEGMEGFVEQTTTFDAPSSDEAVDLGLSVKWAPYNVGASKPTEYGNYYAWGEIEPKTDYSSETYIGPADFFGSVDTYGTEYDVAYVKWGHEWRIPTMDELIEIQEKCKWESTEQDGVKGMKVTGPNGNSIFFPAAGRCVGNRFEDVGITGHYWQGCANNDGSQTGEHIYYDLNVISNGLSIRAVYNNNANIRVYENINSNEWENLVCKDENTFILAEENNNAIRVVGFCDSVTSYINVNYVDKQVLIYSENIKINILFTDDHAIIVSNINGVVSSERVDYNLTRSVSDFDMLKTLFGEAINNIIENNPLLDAIVSPIELMKYLYETDDMNHYEKLDYITDGGYELIPPELLDRLFDWAKNEETTNQSNPTYIIGLNTGNPNAVYSESAICSIDGYLQAQANDGSFDFDYGICYSETSNPQVSDFSVSKNINSNYFNSITLSLPENVRLSGLKRGTQYYYRAFFKDNLTNEVIYSSSIKNFTTKDSPRIIKCTQIDNAYFANGTVVFNAEVEANIGTSYKSESEKPTDWGVILYRNEQSIESFSIGVGKSTGNVNISFSSEKEYLKTDYTNYTATTSENYSLKAYITYTYDGIDINYVSDESFPVDLVYDQKPSMTIKNLSVGSTVSISEGNWDRKTSYSHDLEVTGAFWMDEVYSYYVGNWTTPGKQGAFIPYDGTISWSGDFGVKFSSEADPHSSYKYFGAIVNGAELKSTNNVVYYFNGGSCSISLSGGTRSAPIGNGINNVNYSAYGSGMIIPNKTVK